VGPPDFMDKILTMAGKMRFLQARSCCDKTVEAKAAIRNLRLFYRGAQNRTHRPTI